MRSAMAETTTCRPSRRLAAGGISRISRAIAVTGGRSALITDGFIDCLAQIAFMPIKGLRSLHRPEPESQQARNLHVAIRLFDEARSIARRAANDLGDNHLGAPP